MNPMVGFIIFLGLVNMKITFNKLNKNNLKENKTQGFYSMGCTVNIQNKIFCFTGASSKMPRSSIARILSSKGGIFTNTVTRAVDYLVVGNKGNSNWAFSSYGLKIQKALALQKANGKILIIHEEDFWKAIENIDSISFIQDSSLKND